MKNKTKFISFLASLIVGSIAYNINLELEKTKIMNMSSFELCSILMVLGPFLISFLICTYSKEKTSKVSLLVYAGIVLSIIIRVIYDINFSTLSHNLLGIEIIIYSVLSLPSAFIGAVFGNSIAYRNKKK